MSRNGQLNILADAVQKAHGGEAALRVLEEHLAARDAPVAPPEPTCPTCNKARSFVRCSDGFHYAPPVETPEHIPAFETYPPRFTRPVETPRRMQANPMKYGARHHVEHDHEMACDGNHRCIPVTEGSNQ